MKTVNSICLLVGRIIVLVIVWMNIHWSVAALLTWIVIENEVTGFATVILLIELLSSLTKDKKDVQ